MMRLFFGNEQTMIDVITRIITFMTVLHAFDILYDLY